jgi:hypothetical protein
MGGSFALCVRMGGLYGVLVPGSCVGVQ